MLSVLLCILMEEDITAVDLLGARCCKLKPEMLSLGLGQLVS